ncbi:MAG TPA: cyclophilin-like fold protein [Bacillota bacterium]|jgi:hypothetical protein|nr:hypothetical protein [Peptococcaceae bacterium]HPZ43152.1 cyclophilin-like fold protein [Bacillota bacterium]HQD75890.1 cyclophilin-like fold protein [Bacillota bacterium]HUM58403.1 cyclophilin-like fold protein [Bacillota bacterium]
MKALIKSGSFSWEATIYDTPTGKLIYQALPLKGAANRWGEEIYFRIPVQADLEPGASDVVSRGDLGYWPTGNAFCIFFGPTPVSRGEEIRAASAVNVFGRVEGDLSNLNAVNDGDEVVILKKE